MGFTVDLVFMDYGPELRDWGSGSGFRDEG